MASDHLHHSPHTRSTNKNISPQARAFIESGIPVPAHTPLNSGNIESIRQQALKIYQTGIDYAIENYVGNMGTQVIGGIKCMEILPQKPNPNLADTILLYFFGGGFIQGSPEEDLAISGYISHTLGIRVIAPYYRRAPEFTYPGAVDDGFDVYRTLCADQSITRLLIAGESAGGNLTLGILLNALRHNLAMPVACALMSPWCDLEHSGDTENSNDGRDPTLTLEYVENAARLYAGERQRKDWHISPLNADFDSRLPATFITTGTRDLLMSQCVRLSAKLRKAGVKVDLRLWEEMWHVFEFYPHIPEGPKSLSEICHFFTTHLK